MDEEVGTCLICKHGMASKVNIFKMRTSISKTLLASKLSKVVQDTFDQDNMESQDICTHCSILLDTLDECECKFMALENEVKLKYKIPFAIDVDSRVSDKFASERGALLAQNETPVTEAELPAVGRVEELGTTVVGQPQEQQQEQQQQQNFGMFGEMKFDSFSIVIQPPQVDVGEQLHKKEAANNQSSEGMGMPFFEDIETCFENEDDNRSESSESESHLESSSRPTRAEKHTQPVIRRRAFNPSVPSKTNAVTCHLCGGEYSNAKSLEGHMASHAYDKKLSCGFCPLEFITHMLLHKHWNLEHYDELLPCPHCNERFVTKSSLRRHMTKHKEPQLRCKDCGKAFHSAGDLRKHGLLKHSDVKSFPCPDCPMKFKLNWMLVRHRVRMHGLQK